MRSMHLFLLLAIQTERTKEIPVLTLRTLRASENLRNVFWTQLWERRFFLSVYLIQKCFWLSPCFSAHSGHYLQCVSHIYFLLSVGLIFTAVTAQVLELCSPGSLLGHCAAPGLAASHCHGGQASALLSSSKVWVGKVGSTLLATSVWYQHLTTLEDGNVLVGLVLVCLFIFQTSWDFHVLPWFQELCTVWKEKPKQSKANANRQHSFYPPKCYSMSSCPQCLEDEPVILHHVVLMDIFLASVPQTALTGLEIAVFYWK